MDIIAQFRQAQECGEKPALLHFRDGDDELAILGISPTKILEVKGGRLYVDGTEQGAALDIFDHISPSPGSRFFPAFIGFFSYEFARYLSLPVCEQSTSIPDAFFLYYPEGIVAKNGAIVEGHGLVKSLPQDPCGKPAFSKLELPLSQEEFFNKVAQIKSAIACGDVYQVNLSFPLSFTLADDDCPKLYAAMRQYNESPLMGMMSHDDWWLLSGSPERLFKFHQNMLTTRPIAGTKKRAADAHGDDALVTELLSCGKESAEHAMLVDLMRNDLSKVAKDSSVTVSEDRSVEFYSHVMHLVSEVSATSNASLKEIIAALFPGGTVTGAPKESVMGQIAKLELGPRGPYTGSLGYISSGFGCDFNIVIRSVIKEGSAARINAGAGIVIDSCPEKEWQEIVKKASSIADIMAGRAAVKPERSVIKGPSLAKPTAFLAKTRTRVLFIENRDSFSHNIVAAIQALGANVIISDGTSQTDVTDITHVVIGPGPGSPDFMPHLTAVIEQAIKQKNAILGICLGHQAIGHAFGAAIVRMSMPTHGKRSQVTHTGLRLFQGINNPASFARYHSLAISHAPKDFVVDAHSDDDYIMAISHATLPIFGVQFHPESYLSVDGDRLLKNFLET